MNNYWVNFVKTSDPNGQGLPEWTTYKKGTGNILEMGDQAKLSHGLYKKEFDFLGTH